MEYDSEFVFNLMPIVGTILGIGVAIIIVIQRLKWRWRMNVNCWFCNRNTKVYRQEVDWWQCPSCEQYNGFSKDGDYNYEIPEQRKKLLNNSAKLYSSPIRTELLEKKNGLCTTCNRNEELKLHELNSVDSSRWCDSEVQTFRDNLEEKYPLCKKCNTFVRKLLKKQSLWLTQYKMLAFKQKPMKIIANNSAKIEKLCRIFLTLLSAGLICYPTYRPLPIIGALLQLITASTGPIRRGNSDLLLTLVWVGIGVLTPFNQFILLKPNLNLPWAALEYITGYQIIAVLSSIVGFTNVTSRRSSTSKLNMSFKKLDSPIANHHYSIPKIKDDIDYGTNENIADTKPARRSPVDISHLLTTPVETADASASIKPTIISPNFRICDSQRSTLSTSFNTKNHEIDVFETSPKHSPTKKNNSRKNSLNESLRTLSGLSLSENHQKQTLKNPKVFETKMYGTTSPELFRRSYKTTGRKFILAPPKLKSVSQTSWVAGGYWQTGMEPPTLSRSSSQSSGFGSAGSIFGPSREPSVLNDVDRCSTMSDATQCCHTIQRQSSISPVNTFCQHTSPLSPMTYRQSRSQSTSPTTNMMVTTNPCIQSGQPSFCHSYHMNDQCLQNRNIDFNMIQRSSQVLPCVNYPSNILTSPVWLPALLCGSLLFNMVVFCTVLLR